MELKEAIQYALEGKAILFAGSGFSHGAKNFHGEAFKTGIGLRDSLSKSCRIDAKDYSLSAVADFYTESSGHSVNDLISFLVDEFTLGEIAPAHEIIMSIKWKRVYTTNYDLVIEEGKAQNLTIIHFFRLLLKIVWMLILKNKSVFISMVLFKI